MLTLMDKLTDIGLLTETLHSNSRDRLIHPLLSERVNRPIQVKEL